MSMVHGSGAVERTKGQVDSQIDAMVGAITDLEQIWATLEERLGPITWVPEAKSDAPIEQPIEALCSHADLVRDQVGRISNITRKIHTARENLQL